MLCQGRNQVITIVLLVGSMPASALAQSGRGAHAAVLTPAKSMQFEQATASPDLLVLKDGSLVRGTITEYVPEMGVTMQLPTGEFWTLDLDQVRYAGPAKDAPADVWAQAPVENEAGRSPNAVLVRVAGSNRKSLVGHTARVP